MKEVFLNSKNLGLLSNAFLKGLIPKPLHNQLLVNNENAEDGCILYFEDIFFDLISQKLNQDYKQGKFSSSNYEKGWLDLLSDINSAKDSNASIEGLSQYWLTSEKEEEVVIGVNEAELAKRLNTNGPKDNIRISDVMGPLSEDIISIYQGHIIAYNYRGYLTIDRPIEKKQTFGTTLDLKPVLMMINHYGAKIDRFEVISSIMSDKIHVVFWLY